MNLNRGSQQRKRAAARNKPLMMREPPMICKLRKEKLRPNCGLPMAGNESGEEVLSRRTFSLSVLVRGMLRGLGKNNDVCIRLSGPKDSRHAQAWRRGTKVLLRRVRCIKHEVRRRVHDFVVHQKRSTVRQHINNAGLGGRLKSPLPVPCVDFRLDFVFALAFGPFLFREQSGWKSRRTPLRVETCRFRVPRRLPVHETGKSVGSFAGLYVPATFQYIKRSFARDFRRSGALGEFDFFLARYGKVVRRFGLVVLSERNNIIAREENR